MLSYEPPVGARRPGCRVRPGPLSGPRGLRGARPGLRTGLRWRCGRGRRFADRVPRRPRRGRQRFVASPAEPASSAPVLRLSSLVASYAVPPRSETRPWSRWAHGCPRVRLRRPLLDRRLHLQGSPPHAPRLALDDARRAHRSGQHFGAVGDVCGVPEGRRKPRASARVPCPCGGRAARPVALRRQHRVARRLPSSPSAWTSRENPGGSGAEPNELRRRSEAVVDDRCEETDRPAARRASTRDHSCRDDHKRAARITDVSPTASPTIQPATSWLTSTAPRMVARPMMPPVASTRMEPRSSFVRRRARPGIIP
jgi:hypothetical protein